MTTQGDVNDVEKRWRDPSMVRSAVKFVAVIIVLTGAALAAALVWRSMVAGILVPGILFAGGIAAFVRTYQVWKVGGVWPIWQAAGWFLLLLFFICLGVPFGVASLQ